MSKFLFAAFVLIGFRAQAESRFDVIYEGVIDLSKGHIADNHKEALSPYVGKVRVRLVHAAIPEAPRIAVRSGAGTIGGDEEAGIPGTPYCWTDMIYPMGQMSVAAMDEKGLETYGTLSTPVRGTVWNLTPYDGICAPAVVSESAQVEFESKDFYQANMKFKVPGDLELETHFNTIGGTAAIKDGKLNNVNLNSGNNSSVQWFVRSKKGPLVTGHAEIVLTYVK